MITFINKYKRLFVCLFAIISIIMLFIPALSFRDTNGTELAQVRSTSMLFNKANTLMINLDKVQHMDTNSLDIQQAISFIKSWLTTSIIGCIFIVLGIALSVALIIFIDKPLPYSAPFVSFSLATIIKIGIQCDFSIQGMGTFDAWTDYVIITIALLMLIVDIVRLSLFIRAHKDEIRAKAADISARLKSKLQREHKPTKDERIAELEERVKQLEDKQDE